MNLIDRPEYTKALVKYLEIPEIKILKGVRRCGKSTLLALLAQHLLASGVPEPAIISMSFDEYETPINANAEWLKSQLDEALTKVPAGATAYVFLDEIQVVQDWEQVVRRLYKRPETQIFITGSNAHLLSSDLATHISGRYIEIDVFPLSLPEYKHFCAANGWAFANDSAMLQHYMTYGAMPGIFQFAQEDVEGIAKLLQGIFDTVVLNDVALHSKVSDFDLLSKLIRYVFSTSGNLFSTKKIADTLTSTGRKTAPDTIDQYIRALCEALVLNSCEQFGLAGKEVLRPQRKFYPVDAGIRNLTTGFQTTRDLGYLLENVVFNELLRRGYQVKVGALPNSEVDFVATKQGARIYVQVALTVLDEAVFKRELAPLTRVNDSFPKFIVTLDGMRAGVTEDGVTILGALEFLESSAI